MKSIFPPSVHSLLREAYYKSVPSQIRGLLRGKRRDIVFNQAMDLFLRDPAACACPGNPVINDLIYGWGNEAWSARDELLAGCIEHALASNGSILECGSGLTTVLLGVIAKQQGHSHWILEHKPEWAKKVQKYLTLYGLNSVVCTSPLKDYGEYCWYDISFERLPDGFSLVVCDGPPSRNKGGRYGLVPIMGGRLSPGCIILLDDAGRQAELEIARRWQSELNVPFSTKGINKPYIKMTLATPAAAGGVCLAKTKSC